MWSYIVKGVCVLLGKGIEFAQAELVDDIKTCRRFNVRNQARVEEEATDHMQVNDHKTEIEAAACF